MIKALIRSAKRISERGYDIDEIEDDIDERERE